MLAGLAMGLGVFISVEGFRSNKPVVPTFATYTNGDAATYYNSIDDSQSGNTLLTALRTLNLSKRQSTVGYSNMGTTPSGQFKYTDYDPDYVQYDSNGQPYGTKISSFYTYTSATSWNREHVWPNSHGGGSGGDAGSPYPDADIHMPRPTISSENSSRGNSFFVEGMNHSSNGWDPYTAGYSAESRGEAARITFYCMLVNSKLALAPNNTTPSGTDSVTGISFGSGHTMGNLETLIKWNINYPVTQREKNRNEGAEYLQGNRNAFVDHPEYACKIWGNVNSTIKNMCSSASWDTGTGVSLNKSTASIIVDGTTTISATSSNNSTITWTSSDTNVVTVSSGTSASGANVTLTGIGPGTATITARATISGNAYTATCTITVSSSGGSGSQSEEGDDYSITPADLDTAYPTTAKSYTASSGISFTAYNTANFSSKVQFKKSGGYLYNNNSLNLGTLTLSGVSGTVTVYAGSAKNPSTTTISGSNGVYDLTGYNYFKIINNSSSVATCSSITVGIASSSTKTLSSISVATAPTKTSYSAGEYFNPTGLVINRNYSDSTSDTYTYSGHTSEFTFSPTTSTALTTSHTSVTINYGGKSCTQAITVSPAKTLSSIQVSTAPTKVNYVAGQTFNPLGLVIRRNYSDSTYDTYTYADHTSEFTFSPTTSTALTTSNKTVTITYGGKSTTQSISVVAKALSSIAISGQTTTFKLGDTFSFGGTVTATFNDESNSDVTSSASFSGYNMNALGEQTVQVSYTYSGTTKNASYQITVYPNRVVLEEQSASGTITWSSSNASVVGLSATVTNVQNTYYESNSMRLGTGNGGGQLRINTSINIVSVVVTAKAYSDSRKGTLTVGDKTLNVSSTDYVEFDTLTLGTPTTSLLLSTASSSVRINIQSIVINCLSSQDISTTSDCIAIENFILSCMHMDYTQNLGYCKDGEHHYYSTAKSAFNNLTSAQRSLFVGNSAYTDELARLSAWASANGEVLNASNQLAQGSNVVAFTALSQNNNAITLVIIISMVGMSSIGICLYIRKKRSNI